MNSTSWNRLPWWLDPLDERITTWMARHGITCTRIALGVIFLWFGVLKFFPGMSPAEGLATRTILHITGGMLTPALALDILAVWETLIGLGLLTGRALRFTLLLLFLQMPGTLLPLVLFPGETFTRFPFAPTLEGQYIIKNLVLVAGAIVVGASVRGGRITANPSVRDSQARPTG